MILDYYQEIGPKRFLIYKIIYMIINSCNLSSFIRYREFANNKIQGKILKDISIDSFESSQILSPENKTKLFNFKWLFNKEFKQLSGFYWSNRIS